MTQHLFTADQSQGNQYNSQKTGCLSLSESLLCHLLNVLLCGEIPSDVILVSTTIITGCLNSAKSCHIKSYWRIGQAEQETQT